MNSSVFRTSEKMPQNNLSAVTIPRALNIHAFATYTHRSHPPCWTHLSRSRDVRGSRRTTSTATGSNWFLTRTTKNKTTVDEIKQQNPNKNPATLKPGDTLKFREATMQKVITGFEKITPESVAKKYNASPNGQPDYIRKMKATQELLKSTCVEDAPCE